MLLLANLFIMAFAADAGVSLFEETFRWSTGSSALLPLRESLAFPVAAACVPYLFALCVTPRLPASVFLPVILSGVWLNLGAAPLSIAMESAQSVAFVSCGLQVLVATSALFAIRRRTGGHWLFTPESLRGPAFSPRHTLVSLAVGTFLLAPIAGLYSLVYAGTALQQATHGFIVFDFDGVSLADRRFRKEDREIQLVGMIHIGEQSAYGELFRSFATESTVVLTEGVTDDSHLMQTRLSYAGAAANLGLAPQRGIEEYLEKAREDASISKQWPHVRHADVDVATFSPSTLTFIESAAQMWSSDDWFASLIELSNDPTFADPEFFLRLQSELIDDRNTQLLVQLFEAIAEYEHVVVPWGALHLPEIETVVVERGFKLEESKRHPLISWSALLTALF